MKAKSDQPSAARRQPHLAQDAGEPEAVHEPERERDPGPHVASAAAQDVVGADIDDAERDRRLHDAGGRIHQPERGERQRDRVRERERRHDEEQPLQRPSKQDQTDEKEDVIRPDEDVMDARRQEPPDDLDRSLPGA